jgi:hypothetical protein
MFVYFISHHNVHVLLLLYFQEKMAHGASPWSLVAHGGETYPLPQAMVFLGRDDKCDIVIDVSNMVCIW